MLGAALRDAPHDNPPFSHHRGKSSKKKAPPLGQRGASQGRHLLINGLGIGDPLTCYLQVFVASSHFIWDFSHAALVFGAAANTGDATPAAMLSATSARTIFFIFVTPRENYLGGSSIKIVPT